MRSGCRRGIVVVRQSIRLAEHTLVDTEIARGMAGGAMHLIFPTGRTFRINN